jgi:phosphoglycerate dehydrogenase-like enzyme
MTVLVAVYSQVPSWNIPASCVQRLRAAFPQHTFVHAPAESDVPGAVADADIALMSEMRPHHFTEARRLRWIHSPAAGVGGMLFPALRNSPVVITNSRGMSADVIAEHVLALTLALFRKLPLAIRSQALRHWAQDETAEPPPPRTVRGSRITIIGLGGIGAASAARFAALGAVVTGMRRRLEAPVPEGVTRVVARSDLHAVLVIAAPQTSETRGIIGAEALGLMHGESLLINVSRGKLVDEAALAAALAAGRPGGAGLDVFEHEPLDPQSPLWTLPNVIITPHTAANRPDHWDAATALFAENLRRFERGEALLNVVDKEAGY